MHFTGQLLLPGESGPGLKVNLEIAESHLALESDGGGLGAWSLAVVDVERLRGDLFELQVAGEALRFVADDTLGFTYTAVPAIESVSRISRPWAGVESMLRRLWKDRYQPPPPVSPQTAPAEKPEAVELPEPAEETPPSDPADGRFQPWAEHEAVPEGAVAPEPTPAPTQPAAKPPEAGQPGPPGERCQALGSDGRRCESRILTESGYCYPHSPRQTFDDGYQAAQRARAQLKTDAADRLNRIYDELDEAAGQVARGELDADTAANMAQLAKIMSTILETDESPPGEG